MYRLLRLVIVCVGILSVTVACEQRVQQETQTYKPAQPEYTVEESKEGCDVWAYYKTPMVKALGNHTYMDVSGIAKVESDVPCTLARRAYAQD
jgi:hypothetical protein